MNLDTILTEINSQIKHGTEHTFTFNVDQLPLHNDYSIDIRKVKPFDEIFKCLNDKKNHCLYWFSTSNKNDSQKLKMIVEEKRVLLLNQLDKRVLPAKNNNHNSNILYVGVRKKGGRKYTIINRKRIRDELTNISGRIIQHLGYYVKGTTQGLQLVHWAKNHNIKITLNVIEFENLPDEYLYIIEKLFAIKLKPLLGKH